MRVRAHSWAGGMHFDTFAVRIAPKLAGGNLKLVQMLAFWREQALDEMQVGQPGPIASLLREVVGRTLTNGWADLGYGVLDTATVETAPHVLQMKANGK